MTNYGGVPPTALLPSVPMNPGTTQKTQMFLEWGSPPVFTDRLLGLPGAWGLVFLLHKTLKDFKTILRNISVILLTLKPVAWDFAYTANTKELIKKLQTLLTP